MKVVVRVSDLSQYPPGTKAVTSSKLLRLYGGDAKEMLPVLMGKK